MRRRKLRAAEEAAARTWTGSYRHYDIIKEGVIAFGVVLALVLVLAVVFSSPDDPPTTIKGWSRSAPVDFVQTALSELDGSSTTATYGPPYNHGSTGQHELFIHLQRWLGVSQPIDTARDYVVGPLRSLTGDPQLQRELTAYQTASPSAHAAWTAAYGRALGSARVATGGGISVRPGAYGPVAPMLSALLAFAQAGGLDGALLTSGRFYQTDFTKPLMFIADGGALAARAQAQHLLGGQWGMMNETGSYPGQVWLWLYTFWYQIRPFSTSSNADILVMTMMGVLSLAFVLVPFIPGVRDLPRRIPIHRLIWREHYRGGV